MKKIFKTLIRDWAPPVLIRQIRQKKYFAGKYLSWEEAKPYCIGYDAKEILEKVLTASLKVKTGEAVFERDSVLFNQIEYSWPVTAGLMWVASRDNGRLNVLDFGGSLGSSYFQNLKFLQTLQNVKWNVIEQPHYVKAGQAHFQDHQIRFYSSVYDCLSENLPNVVLMSGVLQYLPDPYDLLSKLTALKINTLIIDRTCYSNSSQEKYIRIQHVPETIYKASYPCHFFSENNLTNFILAQGYKLFEEFSSLDNLDSEAYWKGHIYIIQ